jgi:putative endonuclease
MGRRIDTAVGAGGGSATSVRQQVGRLGEDAAVQHLERLGWSILRRNLRSQAGEIDIVGLDGTELVFVEVRTRSSSRFGAPEEALTAAKARKLVACALTYLTAEGWTGQSWRIDFVAVRVDRGRIQRLEHFKHALQ